MLTASIWLIFSALVGLAILEGASYFLRLTSWGGDVPLFAPPPQDLRDAASALVGAAVAVSATLLGLYYTTVGVVASTIYRDVPGDVRDLFIKERNSEAYLRIVVLTIAGGVAVLVSTALDHDVSGLTLVALGLFTALTCIGLVGVGKRLFDYFDPSKLSGPLVAAVSRGIRTASDPRTRMDLNRQSEAHYAVYGALASFRHLVEMLEGTALRNAHAPVSLSRQLLGVMRYYSGVKYSIPTGSNWWDRVPRHRNWLTLDSNRLQLALTTSVGFAPEMEPDYLWLENSVARLLRKSLAVAFRSQDGANALATSQAVANLVAQFTARLQIDEALALETAWDDVISGVVTTSGVAPDGAPEHALRLNQMAAAESLIVPLTQMLLGLELAARNLLSRDLPSEFERALSDPEAVYEGSLPTSTRQMLETFSAAVAREKKVEGRRVTPNWWVNHYAARSLAEALLATEAGVQQEVTKRTADRVSSLRDDKREDLAAVTGMASLELFRKLQVHGPTIRAAEAQLASYRNSNTNNDEWPERTESPMDPDKARVDMLTELAELLPALRTRKFDSQEPDLYGQLYQFVVEETFRAILTGDHKAGLALYKACLLEMDHARLRIAADLEKHESRLRVTYALEPVIAVMDLAGYSYLMHELNGKGIWTDVRAMWDGMLTSNLEIADFLLTAAMLVDNTFAFTTGGLERSRRSIELTSLLKERDVLGVRRAAGGPVDSSTAGISPVVAAFAPDRYGIHDDLYALFIAEYLMHHLPQGAELGPKTQSLVTQIARYRAKMATHQADAKGSDYESPPAEDES